jgi:hypothetical protein
LPAENLANKAGIPTFKIGNVQAWLCTQLPKQTCGTPQRLLLQPKQGLKNNGTWTSMQQEDMHHKDRQKPGLLIQSKPNAAILYKSVRKWNRPHRARFAATISLL